MKKLFFATLSVLVMILVSSPCYASGFRVTEQSSSAAAMGNAFVGQADDPSALWYNPAGIIQLEGTQIAGGVMAIYPSITHENNTVNPGTTDVSKRDVAFPPHFYITHKMGSDVAFGFGITSPFGLATDWDPQNSSTRYVSTFSKIVTTEFNPNLAYKMSGHLSVAAGITYVYLRATLEKTTPDPFAPINDTNFRLSGDGDGWGFNAALRYSADRIGAGLSYRSRIKVKVEGDAEVLGTPLAGPANTDITLPDMIQGGVSYKVTERLNLNADIEYTMWSTYDRLVINSMVSAFNTTEEKQWTNVWTLRLGAQYKLSEQWKVRAGYYYDNTPVREKYFETRVPDSDVNVYSVGTGYTISNVTIDAAYSYVRYKRRTISDSLMDDAAVTPKAPNALNGNYKTEAHVVGLTLVTKF